MWCRRSHSVKYFLDVVSLSFVWTDFNKWETSNESLSYFYDSDAEQRM